MLPRVFLAVWGVQGGGFSNNLHAFSEKLHRRLIDFARLVRSKNHLAPNGAVGDAYEGLNRYEYILWSWVSYIDIL